MNFSVQGTEIRQTKTVHAVAILLSYTRIFSSFGVLPNELQNLTLNVTNLVSATQCRRAAMMINDRKSKDGDGLVTNDILLKTIFTNTDKETVYATGIRKLNKRRTDGQTLLATPSLAIKGTLKVSTCPWFYPPSNNF
jgi:hypothetical protein